MTRLASAPTVEKGRTGKIRNFTNRTNIPAEAVKKSATDRAPMLAHKDKNHDGKMRLDE